MEIRVSGQVFWLSGFVTAACRRMPEDLKCLLSFQLTVVHMCTKSDSPDLPLWHMVWLNSQLTTPVSAEAS